MRNYILVILTGMLVIIQSVSATETYERKSISYVPVTALISDTVKVPADVRPVFAREIISVFKEMGRWDHNQLPDAVIAEYRKQAGANFKSQSKLRTIIESTIVPEVSKLLEANVIDRAAELLDEADRKRFISEKAKELGIEEGDIRKIMNSAFVGIPFISGFRSAKGDGTLTYKVTGGIAWYNIVSSDGSVKVTYLAEVHHNYSSVASTTKTVYDKKSKKNKVVKRNMAEVRAEAMSQASKAIAKRIRERTKNLAPFQLKAGVIAVEGGTISFSLGSDEDVKLDDKYFLAEYRLDERGQSKRYNIGFARVSSVGKGTAENPTRARVIKTTAVLSEGISLIEHPRSGTEIRFGAWLKEVSLTQGRLVVNGVEYLSYAGPQDISLYLPNIGWSYGLARSTGIPQLFINIDLIASLNKLKEGYVFDAKFHPNPTVILGATLTVSKKFYIGALAVGLEGGGAGMGWLIPHKFKDSTSLGLAELDFTQGAFAGIASGSLEYAATIDINIGVSAGYWFASPASDWSVTLRKPGEAEGTSHDPENIDLPALDISGLEAKVYVNYSFL